MMKWYERYKNRILSIITCLVMCFAFVGSGLEVFAATSNHVFTVPYAQPAVSSTQGYLNVLYEKSGSYYLTTYFWNCTSHSSVAQVENSYVDITFDTTGSSVTFEFYQNTAISNKFYSLGSFNNAGNIGAFHMEEFQGTATKTLYETGYEIVSYQVYGNFGQISGEPYRTSENFEVIYGGDSSIYNSLNTICTYIASNNSLLSTYLPKLNSIYGSVDEVEELLKQLLQEAQVDAETIDKFKDDSNTQSGTINDLNSQTQTDKIDVDSTSQTIDENLNLEVDANYGTLLSVITSNDKILTMMLAAASVGLISFVLFGKR